METWKQIPDFPLYEASTLGRIRSWMPFHGEPIPRILKASPASKGRMRVFLRRDGITYTIQVHRLILETFVGPRPEGMESCHYNDNCHDNRIENLRWDTQEANRADQRRNNKYCRGEDRPESKLTEAQVVEIRNRFANGEKAQKLAEEYGICRDNIYHIKSGHVWKHVGGPVNYVGHNKGENGGRSKLKEHEVIQIRELHRQGLSPSAIASRFDTNRRNVSFIVNRKTWVHI